MAAKQRELPARAGQDPYLIAVPVEPRRRARRQEMPGLRTDLCQILSAK
jgi:hypothetical protein